MKRFLIGFLAVVGALSLIVVGVGIGVGYWLAQRYAGEPELPERMVLTVDLGTTLSEAVAPDPLAGFGLAEPLSVNGLVLALERAATDPRVAGLVGRLDASAHGFAMAQEIRQAVQGFAASGRATVAWADSFGELGPGNEGYYIATAFDEVHLQPGGMVGLTGLIAEVPFVRPLLERLGIEPAVVRRAEYKTAFESLTESDLSAPNREMLNDLLDALFGDLVAGIAERRGLEAGAVKALIDQGPLAAERALEAGLLDGLSYSDQVTDRLLAAAGAGSELVPLEAYARLAAEPAIEPAGTVALVVGQGMIQRGSGGFEQLIGADDLADKLRRAREDEAIDAVVLRLDTGGGSAVAAMTIGREVALLREAGKPVVVSMSNAAASGGYWIAMGASHIVAQPATFTGSIGVIAGKPVLADAWAMLGVNWASVQRGRNADYLSLQQPFDEAGRAAVEASVERLYERFKAGVAEGRGLSMEAVEAVAKGRVWVGAQALEHGLVDTLGGLAEARAATARLLQLPPEATLELRPYPPPPSTFERLRELADQPWIGTLGQVLIWLDTAAAPGPVQATLPRVR